MTVIRVACLALAVLASAVLHAQTIQFKGKIYAAATVEDCPKQSTPTNGAHCVRSADHIYTIESLAQDKTLSTLTSGDSVYVRVRNKRMSVVKKDKETHYKVLRVWMVEADVP
jgi:hypothetical protein